MFIGGVLYNFMGLDAYDADAGNEIDHVKVGGSGKYSNWMKTMRKVSQMFFPSSNNH